jgi:predicted GIY-YIG superfamily endonuclease
VAGTLVLTPLGPVPIESILPGDEVVSVDAETGAPVVAKVLGVSRGIAAEPCTEVTVDAGNRGAEGFGAEGFGAEGFGADGLETFTATDGHPFLVLSGARLDLRGDAEHVPLYEPLGTPRGRWVRAAELLPGDTVATRSGSATVVRVAPHARPEVVYNLHVEGTARYLVGACGVVVHNSPCSEAAEQAAKGGTYVLKNSDGTVVRTGRTNDLVRREREHGLDHPDLDFEVDKYTDDYRAQRGREQDLHDANPSAHAANGGLDKIKPISDRNKRRGRYLEAGRALR